MGIKVILTGATGMVGEGVLLACLQHSEIDSVLAVCRKPLEINHSKLTTFVTSDFLKIDAREVRFKGYDACFYCAGVSSNGMNENDYTKITYDTTLYLATILLGLNPEIVFNFVSGYQTDSSESGKVMWARIKGRTENALMKMMPKRAFNFRPALMKPMPGQKHFYGYNRWMHKMLYPVLRFVFPSCSIEQITDAMVKATTMGYERSILEVKDIKNLALMSMSG